MVGTIACFVILYVIPAAMSWALFRKIAIVSGKPPEWGEIVVTLFPVINIINVPCLYTDLSTWLPGRRTFSELFFGIKKEHYWDREGGAK